jgi:hypothetical protein
MLGTLLLAATLAVPHAVESGKDFTLADGNRYAAWVHGANVRVLDEETGTTSSVPLPRECRVPEALGDGQLGFVCGKELRLLDVARLTWSTVPSTDQVTSLFNADSVSIRGVGRVWIEADIYVGYHSGDYPEWIERATGRVVGDDPGDLSKYPNLDAPELWTPLCPPLRRKRNPYWTPEEPTGLRWEPPHIAGRRALDTLHGGLILRSCGTAKTRWVTRSRDWDTAFFTGTRVTWIEQRGLDALSSKRSGRGRVRTLDLTTGGVRSWTVPGGVNPDLHVVHTRRHIFLDKLGSSGHSSRYAIDLSPRPGAARTRPDG